jgi:hypothetical protein
MSIKVRLSENLPLQLLLPDGDETLYPLAYVETEEHAPLAGSPFAMTPEALGNYVNDEYIIAPDSPFRRFIATYIVYEDSAHTIESQFYQRATDVFDMVDSPSVYVNQLSTYGNRMSTVYDQATRVQQVIVWPEKNGQAVTGTNCAIAVIDVAGAVVWQASAPTQRADGTFRFTNPFQPSLDGTYYVNITITVDGHPRINKQPFVALG